MTTTREKAQEKPIDQERASRILEARTAAGFTSTRAAAERFGWATSTYNTHEQGQRNPKKTMIAEYAKAYGVSEHWLNTGEGPMYPKGQPPIVIPTGSMKAASMTLDIGPDNWRTHPFIESRTGAYAPIAGITTVSHPYETQCVSKVITKSSALLRNGELIVSVPWEMAGRNLLVGDMVLIQRQRSDFYLTTVALVSGITSDSATFEPLDEPGKPFKLEETDKDIMTIAALVLGTISMGTGEFKVSIG